MHKLSIIVHHGYVDKIDPSYTPFLIAALEDAFSQEGVDLTVKSVDSLTQFEKIYRVEIDSYQSDGVMTVVAVGGVQGTGGAISLYYDVSIFDTAQDQRRIWRARVYSSGSPLVKERRMKILAQELVKRLNQDKLISSKPRKQGKRI